MVEGKEFILFGKITGGDTRHEISSPLIIPAESPYKIKPVYSLKEGLTQQLLQNTVQNALRFLDNAIYEPFPAEILSEYNLCSLQFALKNIHFPDNDDALRLAKRQLIFNELFLLQLSMLKIRGQNKQQTGHKMYAFDMSRYYKSLPFELTNAQKNAIKNCVDDMIMDIPMNRLIQGDVGSGKTAVAAACCFLSHLNGMQSALMAPTEILAAQHYETLKGFLSPLGVNVCLLTGSLSSKNSYNFV